MEKYGIKNCCNQGKVSAAFLFGFLLIFLLTCAIGYGAHSVFESLDSLKRNVNELETANQKLRSDIVILRKQCIMRGELGLNQQNERREVISSPSKLDLTSLLRGPTGPPGPPGPRGADGRDGRPGLHGKDGLAGRDGKDFASLQMLNSIINGTVVKEWSQLRQSLPSYPGATYPRWGRTTCPKGSKVIYKGVMAGPDYRSSGGGSNYQCLPDDPEYEPTTTTPEAFHSSLRSVHYYTEGDDSLLGKALERRYTPCVICETEQRIMTLMIPAKMRCPTSEWTLDYKGYVMSELEHTNRKPNDFTQSQGRASRSYVCVDNDAESLYSKTTHYGAILHPVYGQCSADGGLLNCPPYRDDNSALSCVVCSK